MLARHAKISDIFHVGACLSGTFLRAQLKKMAYSLHALTSMTPSKTMLQASETFDETRQIAFNFAIIALSAKLIKVDGNVTKQEYLAFREAFPINNNDSKVRSLFMMALNEDSPAEQYARLVTSLFPGRKDLYRDILQGLFMIANADLALQADEYTYLSSIASIFGFKKGEWKALLKQLSTPDSTDPYALLGVTKDISAKALKSHYYTLMRRYHPDRHQIDTQMTELMTLKVAALNEAYQTILQERTGNENNKGARTSFRKKWF